MMGQLSTISSKKMKCIRTRKEFIEYSHEFQYMPNPSLEEPSPSLEEQRQGTQHPPISAPIRATVRPPFGRAPGRLPGRRPPAAAPTLAPLDRRQGGPGKSSSSSVLVAARCRDTLSASPSMTTTKPDRGCPRRLAGRRKTGAKAPPPDSGGTPPVAVFVDEAAVNARPASPRPL